MPAHETAATGATSETPGIPSPLTRLPKHKLILGLFPPMQEGAWSPSMAPRSTS